MWNLDFENKDMKVEGDYLGRKGVLTGGVRRPKGGLW
jgi:hypothetical protein